MRNEKWKEKGLRPFQTQNHVYYFRIRKRKSTSFTEEGILKGTIFSLKIVKVQRLNKRNKEYTIDNCKIHVREIWPPRENCFWLHYIPKQRQCGKSVRLGHSQERCLKCGKTREPKVLTLWQPWPPSPEQILPKVVRIFAAQSNSCYPKRRNCHKVQRNFDKSRLWPKRKPYSSETRILQHSAETPFHPANKTFNFPHVLAWDVQ